MQVNLKKNKKKKRLSLYHLVVMNSNENFKIYQKGNL